MIVFVLVDTLTWHHGNNLKNQNLRIQSRLVKAHFPTLFLGYMLTGVATTDLRQFKFISLSFFKTDG